MFARSLSTLVAALAAVAVVAATAVAQTVSDAPPPPAPAPPAPGPGAPAPPPNVVQAPSGVPGACTDKSAPVSAYTAKAARRAAVSHVLTGTASDVGCGVDRVEVSVASRVGKQCRYLAATHKLSGKASCNKPKWMAAKGTTSWTLRMPKKLAAGVYVIRTRATDFAGNAQKVRSHKLRLR
jgi:hypothetical protein